MRKIFLISLCLSTLICWTFPPTACALLYWTPHTDIWMGNTKHAMAYYELRTNTDEIYKWPYAWPRYSGSFDSLSLTETFGELPCYNCPEVQITNEYHSFHWYDVEANDNLVVRVQAWGEGKSAVEFAAQSLVDYVWYIKPIRADAPTQGVGINVMVKYNLIASVFDTWNIDLATWDVRARFWLYKLDQPPTVSPMRSASLFHWTGEPELEKTNTAVVTIYDLAPKETFNARIQSACRLWQWGGVTCDYGCWVDIKPVCAATAMVRLYIDPEQQIAVGSKLYNANDLYKIAYSPDIKSPPPDPEPQKSSIQSILPLLLME